MKKLIILSFSLSYSLKISHIASLFQNLTLSIMQCPKSFSSRI